jgi:hypothetical protein
MKRMIFFLFTVTLFIACNEAAKPAEEAAAEPAKVAAVAPTVTLPYTAAYSSSWSDEVSDNDLLTVLNSYKYWEDGDMAGIKSCLADSIEFYSWSGFEYKGPNVGLLKLWSTSRDSLSSVKITMDAWRKMHSTDKNTDWVSVWYTEVDKYKIGGKVDSAYYQDDNMVVNGKIANYGQHKQYLKKK